MKIDVRRAYHARKIIGTSVKNSTGQQVGKIDDLVLDLERNELRYGILAHGGFLGFGAKRFAIPWEELSLSFDEETKFFLLDVDSGKLTTTRGLENYRDVNLGDPERAREIEATYRKLQRERKSDERRWTPEPSGYTAASPRPAEREAERPSEPLVERNIGEGRPFSSAEDKF